jgi:16S rRNA (cytosine1402-N4)-methyltransferase
VPLESDFHEPVFLEEVKSFFKSLSSRRRTVFYDCNLGGGAHAQGILGELAGDCQYMGVDLDENAILRATKRLSAFKKNITLVHDNYANIIPICQKLGLNGVDGIFMDLGLSSFQINESQKGFSFDRSEDIDMRFGDASPVSAAEILETYSEEKLGKIFSELGEEKYARIIARALVRAREKHPIANTFQLKKIILDAVPKAKLKPVKTLARVFQALRIEANQELDSLQRFLEVIPNVLRSGGLFACISYHSLEDALVKKQLKKYVGVCVCPPTLPVCGCNPRRLLRILDRRALTPSVQELRKNPRSRSAKLRRAIRTDE